MMAIKIIYFYCTQLVSTIDVFHHISESRVRPVFYFGGPRPRVLGIDHAIVAVLRTWFGDGDDTQKVLFKDPSRLCCVMTQQWSVGWCISVSGTLGTV